MWNCRKCEVCGTPGSVKYVGTAGIVKCVGLQEG
jgi:hypothetical protein